MTDRRRTALLATAVVICGTVAGAITGGPSGDGVRTVTQVVTRPGTAAQSQPASSKTTTDPGEIAITPPAAVDAPDTLKELADRGRVEDTRFADFGIVTIAKKTYEGVSMQVDQEGENVPFVPRLVINTKGRYKRMKGVVGISEDALCAENDANVSITNGNGETPWGPRRVGFNSPARFDISIRNRASVTLDQISFAPRGNPCGGEAHVAWGVEFVK